MFGKTEHWQTITPADEKTPLAASAPGPDYMKFIPLLQEMFAEFLGTGLLVFFGCGAVSSTQVGDTPFNGNGILPISFAFGTTVFVMAMCVGDVSGGHFNSAVSTTLALTNALPMWKLLPYIFAQMMGAIIFGGLLRGMTGYSYKSGIALTNINPGQGLMFEIMGTLIICLAVLLIAVRPSDGPKYTHPGFPIGMAVCFAITVAGPFSGGGLNQARTLGAVIYQTDFWTTEAGKHFYIYMLGPLIASLLAPLIALGLYGKKAGLSLPDMSKPPF